MTRTHQRDLSTRATAVYSPCEQYRYRLEIQWDRKLPILMVVGLNPSTATERENDPTIERLERYARRAGYGALEMYNAYAYRATDPKEMQKAFDPTGPENDLHIQTASMYCNTIIFAWGAHCLPARELQIWERIWIANEGSPPPILCWGLTKSGRPKHPLYLSDKTLDSPVQFEPELGERV